FETAVCLPARIPSRLSRLAVLGGKIAAVPPRINQAAVLSAPQSGTGSASNYSYPATHDTSSCRGAQIHRGCLHDELARDRWPRVGTLLRAISGKTLHRISSTCHRFASHWLIPQPFDPEHQRWDAFRHHLEPTLLAGTPG